VIATAEPVSPRFVRSLVHADRTTSAWVIRFSPDGRQVLVAGYPSGVLQFRDVATGVEIRRIATPAGLRGSADYASMPADCSRAYVPLEKRKAVSYQEGGERKWRYDFDGAVLVYDLTTGQALSPLRPTAGRAVLRADVSPDGRRLVAVERLSYRRGEEKNDEAVLWDTGAATSKPLGYGYAMAAFTPDSRQFVVCLNTYAPDCGVLKLVDNSGTTLAELATVKGESFAWPKLSSDGRLLVVELSQLRIDKPATLCVWDMRAKKQIAAFKSGGDFPFADFALTPDGSLLAAADNAGGVRVWDVATGRLVREKSFGKQTMLFRLAISPDGRRLAVNGQPTWDRSEFVDDADPLELPQPRVYLFDLADASAEPETIMCPHGWGGGIAWSPDGKLLAVGGAGATHLFDMTSRK
jgi:WD40 repeat protein